VLIATLAKEIHLPADQMIALNTVALAILVIGIYVYHRVLRRVETRGGLVRTDLFVLPDLLVAGTLAFLLLAMLLLASEPPTPPAEAGPPSQEIQKPKIIEGSLVLALPVAAILALLIGRGVSLPQLFGLKQVGLVRAAGLAVGLLLVLLPFFMFVTLITQQLLGEQADQQPMVKIYQSAAKAGEYEIIWQVFVAAVFIAPITEEILFRGYFYPVLKRFIGPMPAAIATSVLFGTIHNNALGMPGLTLLALGLTLAYEWSGSLLVSIFMHAWFNATTLVFIWWAIQRGLLT